MNVFRLTGEQFGIRLFDEPATLRQIEVYGAFVGDGGDIQPGGAVLRRLTQAELEQLPA